MVPRLFSGVQPTGRLHIGNYLGALKNFVDLQNSGQYQCFYCIVDLHSLTEDFDPSEKPKQVLDLLANFLALGLSPGLTSPPKAKKSTIFIQSHVPAHTELGWILNTIASFGELSRMTQFKDKSERQQENINVGLFAYPVLQAADIVLYDSQFVPVGDDQIQHIELTRTLVRKFNHRFGEIFVEPQVLLTKTPRVMSLQEPTKKMSKSVPDGCIFIDDSPEEIERKVIAAVTDSGSEIKYDPEAKPGLSNLLLIYASLSGKEVHHLEADFANKKYSQFKKSLAKLITKHFASFRRKKEKLLANPTKLEKIARRGANAANKIASEKIAIVKKQIGLI